MLHNTGPQNIKKVVQIGGDLLKKYSPAPTLDSEILLAFVLKKRREFLYSNFEKIVPTKKYNYFLRLIEIRKINYPIAYIIGENEFYGYLFKVSSNVLIPRPETEELIEISRKKITELLKNKKIIKILEVGSGSGCIPIVLKSLFKQKIRIYSYEVSKKAYSQALINYKRLYPGRIMFKNLNVFKDKTIPGKFDLIISNPPYLTKMDMLKLDISVSFEPKIALYGGLDGLLFYKKLYKLINSNLNKTGLAIFEINENLSKKTAAIFTKEYSCEILKDLFKKDRFLLISHQ